MTRMIRFGAVIVQLSSLALFIGMHATFSFGQIWPDGSEKPQVIQSEKIAKARFGADGDLFTLNAGAHEIVRRDPATGTVKGRYHTDAGASARTLETFDFVVDQSGQVHALLLCESDNGNRYSAVRRFQSDDSAQEIRLSRTLLGGTLRVGPDGDYYILGLDARLLEEALSEAHASAPHTLSLIQKYDADGNWLAGLLPVELPASRPDLLRFMEWYPSLSDLEITDSGEVFMLLERLAPDAKPDLSGFAGELYRIDPSGAAEAIPLRSPVPDSLLIDLHVSGNDLFLEWYVKGNKEPFTDATRARHLLVGWRANQPSAAKPVARSTAHILALSPSRIAASRPGSTSGTDLFVTDWSRIRKQ